MGYVNQLKIFLLTVVFFLKDKTNLKIA